MRSGSSSSRFTGAEASPHPPVGSDKAAWRRWARSLPFDVATVGSDVADRLDVWLPEDAIVLTYAAMPGEIDPGVRARHRTFLLTRLAGEGPLTVHRADAAREVHRFGFSQPSPTAPEWDGPIDVVIVPGLVFSTTGHRLGKGAGHYDRFLAGRAIDTRVGVGIDAMVADGFPVDAHDIPMTHLATETGVRAVASA